MQDIIKRPSPEPENRAKLPVSRNDPPANIENKPASNKTDPIDNIDEEMLKSVRPDANTQKNSKKPVGIIITALVICLSLIGLAVYAGMQSESTTTSVNQNVGQSQSSSQPQDASSDVDTALSEAESLPSSSEDLSADLSDQSLGL